MQCSVFKDIDREREREREADDVHAKVFLAQQLYVVMEIEFARISFF